ncbi:MAG: hypothetical protein NSGCLCUN01_03001 [uncultured Clostridium sp.]
MVSEMNNYMTFKSAIYISIYLIIFIRVIILALSKKRIFYNNKVLNIFLFIRSIIQFILDILYGAVILLGSYYWKLFGIVNIFSLCLLISILLTGRIVLNKVIDERIN